MDPIVISSLIALGTQIANTLLKYNDPNLKAPGKETVQAEFAEYLKRLPLPETYDVGFVNSVMDTVNSWVDDFVKNAGVKK